MGDVIRRVMIHGRVQGVGYRAWAAQQARLLDLGGWVRNRRDGSVEAILAGPEAIVAGMIARCRQGPGPAHVASLDDTPADDAQLSLRGRERFAVLPTV